jgi:hypothetical protein
MVSHGSDGRRSYTPAMPAVQRVVRGAMAIATLYTLVWHFTNGEDDPTFDAVNFFSYFTILSNVGAIILLGALAIRPALVGVEGFVVFRGAVTLYMIITGIVYNVLLAPASADVNTNTQWVNFIVHVLGPIVVALDWFVYRSPIKPTVGQMATWWIFPALYLIYTLIRGPFADWYPYPFLDPNQKSVGAIIGYCVGILVAFVLISMILRWWSGPPRRQRVPQPATA